MTDAVVLSIGKQAILTCIYLAGPMLIAAMVIGITVSILQAITQINEATLTFIPKIFAVVIVLVVMAPWMLSTIQDYATMIFGNAGEWVR